MTPSDIDVIVVDECHHAGTGNHQYKQIMTMITDHSRQTHEQVLHIITTNNNTRDEE